MSQGQPQLQSLLLLSRDLSIIDHGKDSIETKRKKCEKVKLNPLSPAKNPLKKPDVVRLGCLYNYLN